MITIYYLNSLNYNVQNLNIQFYSIILQFNYVFYNTYTLMKFKKINIK